MPRVGRQDLRGKAQAVTGLIEPSSLGPTLMHEHLFIDLNPPRFVAEGVDDEQEITICNCFKVRYGQQKSRLNYRLDERAVAVAELAEMYTAGGRTLVELTNGGLKPRPEELREVAQAAAVNIVMGCGHYVQEYQDPANAKRAVDEFAEEMIAQIFEGAWGTTVRAGIIGEIGCQSPWTEQERRLMRGALIAQAETGAALNVHPGRHPDQPQEIAEFVAAAGGPVDRLILSHIDRTIFDDTRLFRLADTGCVIEFDLFGWEQSSYPMADIDMPNDAGRLKMIRALIDRGHLDRVVISQDVCTRTRLTRYGGHGYQHIFANVLPLMSRRGFTSDEIETIMVRNPKRLLTFI